VHISERRQSSRYRLELHLELDSARGQTRDVSASGAFLEFDEPFAPGAVVSFALVFGGSLRVRCEGDVVRVEARGGKVGVAVAIASYRFE